MIAERMTVEARTRTQVRVKVKVKGDEDEGGQTEPGRLNFVSC